jgi:hypothetical protein
MLDLPPNLGAQSASAEREPLRARPMPAVSAGADHELQVLGGPAFLDRGAGASGRNVYHDGCPQQLHQDLRGAETVTLPHSPTRSFNSHRERGETSRERSVTGPSLAA